MAYERRVSSQPLLPTAAEIALVVVSLVLFAFLVWMYVRIIRRTGYSGWWVLMAFVPVGNLIALAFFAFSEWPIHRELAHLRRHAAATGLPGYGPPR
jgi:uncharacterized membrane protein YhaH (DUF805 family)